LKSELAQARLAQRSFVSLRGLVVPGYDLASHYEAAREIGGDFFELFQLHRRRRPVGVVIADVTGKGIGAGMLMAFARPVIHAALDASRGPADALERTNRILVDEIRSGLFITAIAGVLDVSAGRLRMANAGTSPRMCRAMKRVDQTPSRGGCSFGAFRPWAPRADVQLARTPRATPGRGDRRSARQANGSASPPADDHRGAHRGRHTTSSPRSGCRGGFRGTVLRRTT
jgi:hypothetical protein